MINVKKEFEHEQQFELFKQFNQYILNSVDKDEYTTENNKGESILTGYRWDTFKSSNFENVHEYMYLTPAQT